MSKGSPIVPIRIPAELLALIDADVERSIQHDSEPRSTRTAWIIHAVLEVLRHRARARKSRLKYQSGRWRAMEELDQLTQEIQKLNEME